MVQAMIAHLAARDDAGEQLLKLVSNPFQAALQTNAFWASLGTSLGLTVLLAALFSFVRPRHTLVYAPKIKHADEKHAPPPMGKGLLAWIGPVSKAKEEYLMDKIGFDAVLFLRFARMLRNMFVILALVGLCIMIPVNVTLGNKAISSGLSAFTVMTPLYVFGNGLWAQVVLAWAIDIIVAYFLWHNYRRIHQLRRNYFESPEYLSSLHSRTLLIRQIPSNLRSDEGIQRITDEVNPTGVSPRTTISRNVKVLPDLIEEHEELVRELESVLAKYFKNPNRLPPNRPTMKPSKKHAGKSVNGKVDAIEYLTERIRELESEIGEIRERVDMRDPLSFGFASWDNAAQAHSVAFAARKKQPQGTTIQLAPKPSNLIWTNLPLSRASRRNKKFWNGVWVTILTLIWLPLNAAIAIFLSNLSNLGSVWPGFQQQLETNSGFWALVQGIAAPAITSVVYLILPTIFRRLQIRAGDVTKTSRDRHVLRNLYLFFTLNNLVVFSLFAAIWQYITVVIENNQGNLWDALKKGQFFLTITTALCQISPFWVTWILQRNLGAATDLAQLWSLTYMWFKRTFMAPTPRQNIEWTAPPSFEYASYYNYFLFYATVALCFSTLQPVILIVTALYFCIDAFLKKYLLMYVFVTKNESGGQFWKTLYNRLVFAVILSNFVIAVVVKARGTWSMVIALAPAVLLMLAFKWYCVKTFDLDIKYYRRTGMNDQERSGFDDKIQKPEKISKKFGHPALHKRLMTPMVHAKAKQLLSDIYTGRTSVDERANVYSDIAMQPMSHNGRQTEDAPFEIVPESRQDFAYYKNRDDFRDEAGELYGSDDATTLRSQTPMSFVDKSGNYSRPTSRTNSPSPDLSKGMQRKPVGGHNIHPTLRPGYQSNQISHAREESDLGMKHGLYTDPDDDDDHTNLLSNATNLPTPRGEFMSMDRWQTGSSAGTPRGESGPGSYDYFRTR